MKSRLSITAVLALTLSFFAATTKADTYEAKAGMSYINFKLKHFGVSNAYGRFNDFIGTIEGDPNSPESFKLSFEVVVDSVDTGIKKRDDHLRGPDFFNSKEFPKITFNSTSVKAVEGKTNHFTISGKVTLLGVTKDVTADFEYFGTGKAMRGADIAGGEATMKIKRSDFGMKYGLPDSIGDEVTLTIALQAYKQ